MLKVGNMQLASNIDLQSGMIGGIILAGASTILLYTHGKIAGLSGIFEGMLIFRPNDDKRWCWSFVGGLVSSGTVLLKYYPQAFNGDTTLTPSTVVAAGIITGFGARLGSGCTSGHGICGLPRLSLRSLVAVCTFMLTGGITAYLSRETSLSQHLLTTVHSDLFMEPMHKALLPSVLATIASVVTFSYNGWLGYFMGIKEDPSDKKVSLLEHIGAYACGLLFGVGLGVSGMCNPDRVINFLNFSNKDAGWDPSLMAVMGGGVVFNLLTFRWLSQCQLQPMLNSAIASVGDVLKMGTHPANLKIDWKLVIGSALFGVGWGLAGICPGPGMVSLGGMRNNAVLFIPSLIGGVALNQLMSGNPFNLPKSSKAQ